MRFVSLSLSLVLGLARPAGADPLGDTFQAMVGKSLTIVEIAGFVLPAGGYYTHVLYGVGEHPHGRVAALALLRCGPRTCERTDISLKGAQQVELLGVVDLRGAPGPLSTLEAVHPFNRTNYEPLPKAPDRLRDGALVIRTSETSEPTTDRDRSSRPVTGTHTRETLIVLSLRKHTAVPILDEPVRDTYPVGTGSIASFALVRGNGALLDVSSETQRQLMKDSGCPAPKPFAQRWRLGDDRYVPDPAKPPLRDSCY